MARIAFFCIPAQGHTNPTLGVVKELTARGHEVRYYSYEPMREKIEAAGAAFIPCDHYDPQMELSDRDAQRVGKDLVFSMELIVNVTLALDEAILAELARWKPQVVVADSMAFWGKLAAGKLGIPFVSSTTTFAFNRYSARILKQGFGETVRSLLSMGRAGRVVRRLRDRGYPVKGALDIVQNDNDTPTIVYTSPEFQPCADTFSDKYRFVGPSIRPAEKPLKKGDKPLLYISLGTVNNDRADFFRSCIQALGDMDLQVVLSLGDRVDRASLGPIPAGWTAKPSVDQMAILQAADGFLTHCGMNSVNEALFFGVPLLLFPQTQEQRGVALRAQELGAGLFLEEPTPQAIRRGVEALLAGPSYREKARAIGESFRRRGGVREAADFILAQAQ